ncbi:FlhC family transcriptional regulator, partial [Salmonella enterica subsp. enterica serovar Typhimurium]|nr:FlhC family transcriptional regulator [Salmonella enterica subsp. enterica serovar Typhimurium]
IVKAFKLYQEHVQTHDMEEVLSLTRAWTLVRFFDAKLLQHTKCTCCGGHFVAHAYDPKASYVCGLCNIPARAGKTRRAREALIA